MTFITLLLSKIGFAMSSMPPASHFFKGTQLEIAQAIDKADADLAGSLAKKIGRVELDRPGTDGMTLLMYAANKAIPESPKRLAVVTALLRAGADALQQSPPGEGEASLISVALLRANGGKGSAFLKALLDGGMNPDSVEYHGSGSSIIFRVANQDTPESLELLIARGANVNAKDRLGSTPIMKALNTFSLDEVNYLLDHGADPKVVNLLGRSFASRVFEYVNTQKNDPLKRYPKILGLRDRIIAMGVEWPPASEVVERDRMRAKGIKPIIPAGEEK